MQEQKLKRKILELIQDFEGELAFVIEADGEVISYQEDQIFQSASLIKLPILIEGFRQSESGKINLETVVGIHKDEITGGSGVLATLSDQVKLTVNDLLTLMIIVSDNTATNQLISLLGQDEINQCMLDIGLKNTSLKRRMMDSKAIKEHRDNTTTAIDMITCLKTIMQSENRDQMLSIMDQQQFTDKLPAWIGEEVKIACKSGGLPGVAHDVAIIRFGTKTIYVAVLTANVVAVENSRQLIGNIGRLIYEEWIKV